MNPKADKQMKRGLFSKFKGRAWLLFLPLCVLVTGCPHNEYIVELKPAGDTLERTLTFYRADGSNSNGVPNYQEFSTNELAAITAVYPVGAVKSDGQRHVATGEFGAAMPNDIGGAGTYTNLATSLGDAGFYVERFRGDDDIAGRTARQMRAADHLTDLLIGWAKGQFGREHNWKKLRQFLDDDFRKDLKNASLYYWTAKTADLFNTNAPEEFVARFSLYLMERDYLKSSDLGTIYAMLNGGGDESFVQNFVRPLLLAKLEIPPSGPVPKSFAVLDDNEALEKSMEQYLAKTDLYRAKLKEWKQKLKSDPKLAQPQPSEVTDDLFRELTGDFFKEGETDHLVVKLALPLAPNYSNGQWRDGLVTWDVQLERDRALPAVCYATWSHPGEQFQKAHFGGVILAGDELAEYCLWQSHLDRAQAQAWESFLAGLQSGNDLLEKLEAYQFTPKPGGTNQPDAGRKLLVGVLPQAAKAEKSK